MPVLSIISLFAFTACGDSSQNTLDEASRTQAARKFKDAPRTRSTIDDYRRRLPRPARNMTDDSERWSEPIFLYNPNRTLRLRVRLDREYRDRKIRGLPRHERRPLCEMRVETGDGRLLRNIIPGHPVRWLDNNRLEVCYRLSRDAPPRCETLSAGAFVRRAAPAPDGSP